MFAEKTLFVKAWSCFVAIERQVPARPSSCMLAIGPNRSGRRIEHPKGEVPADLVACGDAALAVCWSWTGDAFASPSSLWLLSSSGYERAIEIEDEEILPSPYCVLGQSCKSVFFQMTRRDTGVDGNYDYSLVELDLESHDHRVLIRSIPNLSSQVR
jgi:hypothetical protein